MSQDIPTIEVNADSSSVDYWREVWQFRDLLYILSWRDIKVRYKQTLIGAGWAIIRPLVTLIIFTFVFGNIAGLSDTATAPYPLLVLGGVLAWQLFSSAISESAGSMLGNERLITKVYFPRIIIPISTIATCLLDFAIALVLLVGLFLYYGQWPVWEWWLLPFWLALVLVLSLGIGLWLAALNVQFRDFRYALPFVLQVGLFLSPVGFTTTSVPEAWQWLYVLNPAVGVIEGFRWCLLGSVTGGFPAASLIISAVWAVVAFGSGFAYFRRAERTFSDVI